MGRPAKRTTRGAVVRDPIDSGVKQEEDDPVDLLTRQIKKTRKNKPESDLSFVGPPVPAIEAHKRWPTRYKYSFKVQAFFIFAFGL